MRRTGIARGSSELQRRTPLRSGTMPRTPQEPDGGAGGVVPVPRGGFGVRKPPGADEKAAKAAVRARSGGVSEVSGVSAVPVDWSHRIGRAQGGPWSADNGCHLTRLEHGWLTRPKNRLHAEAGGWVLRGWQSPASEWPIYLPTLGGWRILRADGGHDAAPWQPAPTRGPWEVWTP